MSALDFAARGMARRLEADLREGLSALTLPDIAAASQLDLARIVAPGATVRIAALNDARSRLERASQLPSGFAQGAGFAWFTDAGGAVWANSNAEPTVLEFGADPRAGLTPSQVRTQMQMLIDWARYRGLRKYHLAPDVGIPYVVDHQPFIRSGTRTDPVTVVIDGTIENRTDPAAGNASFVGSCIGLGEHHPAYFHAGWPAGTAMPRYAITPPAVGATTVTISDTGSNRVDGVAAIQAAQAASPDGKVRVFVYSDAGYIHASGATIQNGFTLSETAASVGADGAISLHDAVAHNVSGAWFVSLADNPGTIHNTSGKHHQYTCAHVNVVGSGTLKSTGDAFGRTATYRVTVNMGRLEVANGYYFNTIHYSHFHVSHVEVTRKFVDIAGNSGYSSFGADTWSFEGPGIEDVPAVAFGENSHDCEVRGKDMLLPKWSRTNGVLYYGSARRCGVLLTGQLFAPLAQANPIYVHAANFTGTEPDRSDHWLDIGGRITFGAHQRDVLISNSSIKRFNLRRARLPGGGSVNGESVRDLGTGTIYDSGVDAIGKLRIESTAGGGAVLNRPRFASGYEVSHDRSRVGTGAIVTDAAAKLRAIRVPPTMKTVNALAAGSDVITVQVPADAISPGNTVRIGIRALGNGTVAAKTIAVAVNGTSIASIAIPAGNNLPVTVDLDLFASNNARLSVKGLTVLNTAAAAVHKLLTGLDLAANGMTITIDAFKVNAGDSLTLEPYWVEVSRPDEAIGT